jgi:hypothetical protein
LLDRQFSSVFQYSCQAQISASGLSQINSLSHGFVTKHLQRRLLKVQKEQLGKLNEVVNESLTKNSVDPFSIAENGRYLQVCAPSLINSCFNSLRLILGILPICSHFCKADQ